MARAKLPRKKRRFWWLWIVAALVIIYAIGSSSGGDKTTSANPSSNQAAAPAADSVAVPAEPTPAPTAVPAIDITAAKLYKAYDENELAADDNYKGKILRVSGKVGSIDQDMFNSLYVTLDTGDYNIFSVQCYFSDSERQKLTSLKKGGKATIVGRCEGWSGNILLKDCTIE